MAVASANVQSSLSPARVLLFICGSVFYSLLGILSQLSKNADGSYGYSLPTVVMMAELNKLVISLGLFAYECGSLNIALGTIFSSGVGKLLAFTIPSVLYSCNNNLDMLNNLYMDPATHQVLAQCKILTTGLVWWCVFRETLGGRKWVALVVLFLGALLAGNPSGGHSEGGVRKMYITGFGLILITIYVWVSAIAGVYNEWLYKGIGKDESIHLCNIRLYSIGIVFNIGVHLYSSSSSHIQPTVHWNNFTDIFTGYNVWTWMLVFTYTFMGLLISQVMKYFDNIVKLFMSGSSMYLSALAAWTLFGFKPTVQFIAGLWLTTIALVMYNLDKVWNAKGVAAVDMMLFRLANPREIHPGLRFGIFVMIAGGCMVFGVLNFVLQHPPE